MRIQISRLLLSHRAIVKLLNEKDTDGTQMVYIDKSSNDTVRVFIPAEKMQQAQNEAVVPVLPSKDSNTASVADSLHLTITPTIVKPAEDTVTLTNDTIKVYKEPDKKQDIGASKDSSNKREQSAATPTQAGDMPKDKDARKNSAPAKSAEIIVLPKAVTHSNVNSDCRAFANSEDFLRLRKKMAAQTNNEDMIQTAKKVFRSKCFSTEQIRNLSYLFLTDEGKYMFFDAAYAFTADSDQYYLLQSQLKDEYYINRFKAMIHN